MAVGPFFRATLVQDASLPTGCPLCCCFCLFVCLFVCLFFFGGGGRLSSARGVQRRGEKRLERWGRGRRGQRRAFSPLPRPQLCGYESEAESLWACCGMLYIGLKQVRRRGLTAALFDAHLRKMVIDSLFLANIEFPPKHSQPSISR